MSLRNMLNSKNFTLFGKGQGKMAPKLFFQVSDKGNLGVAVFPNDPSDSEKKPISMTFSQQRENLFFAALRQAIAGRNVDIRVDQMGGKDRNNLFTESMFILKDDENGGLGIEVVRKGRAKVRFEFAPGDYDRIVTRGGDDADPHIRSRIIAESMLMGLEQTMAKVRPLRENDGGGNGGGGNSNYGGGNSGGGNGNYNNESSGGGSDDFGDDIPF